MNLHPVPADYAKDIHMIEVFKKQYFTESPHFLFPFSLIVLFH